MYEIRQYNCKMQYTLVFMCDNNNFKTIVMTNDDNIIKIQRLIESIDDKIYVFENHMVNSVNILRLKKKRDNYLDQLRKFKAQKKT